MVSIPLMLGVGACSAAGPARPPRGRLLKTKTPPPPLASARLLTGSLPLPFFFSTSSAALALLACAAGAAADSLNLIADPLDLSNELPTDYRNWASVMSQVRGGRDGTRGERKKKRARARARLFCSLASFFSLSLSQRSPSSSLSLPPTIQVFLKKEGSEEAAADALGRVMLAAHGHLAKVANGEPLFPRLHLADPVFAAEGHGLADALEEVVGKVAGKVKGKIPTTTVTKFAASKTFFNYAPCVLSETKLGVAAGLTGLNFAPNLLSFFPTGLFGQVVGINVVPQLLWVQPTGVNIQPQVRACVCVRARGAGRGGAGVFMHWRAHFCVFFFFLLSPSLLFPSPPHDNNDRVSTCSPFWLTSVRGARFFGEKKRRRRPGCARLEEKKNPTRPPALFIHRPSHPFSLTSFFLAGPIGANVQPQGVNVQPIKLAVAPIGKNVQPQGKVVAPAKLVYAPVKVLYNPQKGPVYAPVGQDLTKLDEGTPAAPAATDAGAEVGGGGL